jgi:hypothetical protein
VTADASHVNNVIGTYHEQIFVLSRDRGGEPQPEPMRRMVIPPTAVAAAA